MNGFAVGHKRLKVEQKKDKHAVVSTMLPPPIQVQVPLPVSVATPPPAAYYPTLHRYARLPLVAVACIEDYSSRER